MNHRVHVHLMFKCLLFCLTERQDSLLCRCTDISNV